MKRLIETLALGCCLSVLQGQDSIDSLADWEVWRHVSAAVEQGWLSQAGAESVLRHIQEEGWPVSPEEAWRIEGLSELEREWLIHSEAWRSWVLRHEAWQPAQKKTPSFVGTSAWKFKETGSVLTHDVRLKWGEMRGGVSIEDSVVWSGSWSRRVNGWTCVLGDHQVGWGHGLTLPRADAFGLALFVGGSEVRLPFAPRGLYHARFEGGLGGLALEHRGSSWTHGITASGRHMGWMTQRHQTTTWGLSAFCEEDDVKVGVDWTGQKGSMDWQWAGAWTLEQGWRIRASLRWARGTTWVAQGAYEGGVRGEDGQWRVFSTWQHPESRGLVQMRLRCRTAQDWDVRFQGQPFKGSAWRWSTWGTPSEFMCGLHLRKKALKSAWWLGRDRSGNFAYARHVEGAWGPKKDVQWGLFAMDGHGDWRGAYVMVRALDGRVWSRTPGTGWRLGVWVTQKVSREGTWTAQCTWSPSQQEAFRCAWRWRWEP